MRENRRVRENGRVREDGLVREDDTGKDRGPATRRPAARAVLAIAGPAALLLATAGSSQAAAVRIAPARSAPASFIGIRLLQAPVSERDDPRAYEYIIDHLATNTTIRRQFQVADTGQTAVTVSVYAAAASISGGSFQFAAGHTQNEMTRWVSVSRPVLSLKPQQRATDVVTIAVPPRATRGDQYGVIWAQVGGNGPGNVKLISRVGIRIYLSVGAGGAPPSTFRMSTPGATRVQGHPVLSVPVTNTGGLAVDVAGSLSLSGGPGGVRGGPFRSAPVVTLAPGQSGTVVYTLPSALANGPWQAMITMQRGLLTVTGQYTVNFAGPVSGYGFLLVLVALAVLALLVAGGVLLFLRRRRRGPGQLTGRRQPEGSHV
ncbi:MAG: hypothetical protein ABSF03_17030 [Streptosporangiaceae bacterium]